MVQLTVKKPKVILFDISGTVAKSSFIDKVRSHKTSIFF